MTYRVLLFLGVIFLAGCGEGSKSLLPRNSGSLGEVAVVAPAEVWSTSLGDHIGKAMGRVMYGLPQDELLLKRLEIKESGFNDMFRTHRNVLKIEVDPTQKSGVTVKRDVFSSQQLFIIIHVPSLDELTSVVDARIDVILDLFYQAEIFRLVRRNRAFGSEKLNAEIAEKTELSISMQDKFEVAVESDDFLWLRLDQSMPLGGYQHTISQGFMIYWRPYTDTLDFSDSSLYAWKSEINAQYVSGPQNSHMTISDRFILPQAKFITFQDQTAKEIRGLWRMEGYFMGGPFYALAFYNPNNGMQYMVEGYAYAPQFDKAPLIREIEAIAKSVTTQIAVSPGN